VHMLVEGFSVFGIQAQYWMLIAVAIIATGVTAAWWTGLGSQLGKFGGPCAGAAPTEAGRSL
jgi:hypothetical protein